MGVGHSAFRLDGVALQAQLSPGTVAPVTVTSAEDHRMWTVESQGTELSHPKCVELYRASWSANPLVVPLLPCRQWKTCVITKWRSHSTQGCRKCPLSLSAPLYSPFSSLVSPASGPKASPWTDRAHCKAALEDATSSCVSRCLPVLFCLWEFFVGGTACRLLGCSASAAPALERGLLSSYCVLHRGRPS